MLQNSIIVKQRHERFLKKVCETAVVWGLESSEGFATSSSNGYEDSEGEPVGLICFWSERALAKSCMKDDWSDYKLVEVSLGDFIENWCVGMSGDDLMVGTNFDSNMFGFEADPLDVIIELSKELNNQGKGIELQKYKLLDDLVNEIINIKSAK
ncbi:hypothetical protein WSM22_46850 [Cytophagales bacterium WSM2-2]|nr:hypothetical protein WSM22_46850 [Cytophagales bacterium WSM2-2]